MRKSKINIAPKKLLNTEIVYLVLQSKVADQFPPSSVFIQCICSYQHRFHEMSQNVIIDKQEFTTTLYSNF